ncbi:MAG: hypothetical protein KatS3mg051_1072 [Anaerolineae bacterium]|nr:MAG: hypothetical protein KatS3mg051_1072 [Anaerolineae bacterium]
MAWEIPTLTFTLEAAADLSAKQYYFVKVDSNGKAARLCRHDRQTGRRAAEQTQARPGGANHGSWVSQRSPPMPP